MVLQAAGACASIMGVLWGHFSVYHVSSIFKVCAICPASKKLIILLERKPCTGNVTLQVFLYCNGGIALANILGAVLNQRFKVTAVLVICCKMYKH